MNEEPSKHIKTFSFILVLFYILYYIYFEISTAPDTSRLVVNSSFPLNCDREKKYFKFDEEALANVPSEFLDRVEQRFFERLGVLDDNCQKLYGKTRNDQIKVTFYSCRGNDQFTHFVFRRRQVSIDGTLLDMPISPTF